MDGCSIFREELAIRYPDHGHALWEPDPRLLYEAVAVGDVGFIDKGSSNGPKYPPRLQPRNPRLRKSRDSHQAFFSEKVTKLSGQSNVSASGPDDVTFSCSGTRGALSYLPIPADREETNAHGDFRKWILKYIDDCCKVAEASGCDIDHMGNIILVTGRHLARSWINVAFSGSESAQVSFTVEVSKDLRVDLSEGGVSGAESKLGPRGEIPPENQCIFVQGYRVVRILNFWPRIRAAGPDSELPDPDPESGSETHLEVVGVPSANYRDPIHVLFEYISEQAFNCDMILVHDNDLGFISGALPSDTLSEYIRNRAPAIQRVRYELSPRDESRSGTEASIVTVATLSYDLLEELSQNQYNLECPQLMDATNESDNEISQLVFQEDAVPQSSDFSRSIFVSPTIDNLSNDAAILHPTISLHDALPGLDRPQGPSTISPQSVSRTDTPLLSIEPENQPSSMPQTVSSSAPTQSTSSVTVLPIHESRTSEEPEEMMELESSDEDSRPVGDIENTSSLTAANNTHMTRRLSTGSSSSLGVSGSNTTGSSEDLAHDRERESSDAPIRSIASQSPSGRRISIVESALLDSSSSPTSSDVPSPRLLHLPGDILVDGFLSHMFSPQDAHAFFTLLLGTTELVSSSRGWWYTNHVQQPSSGLPTRLPLDFSATGTEGTIVPQRRWTPDDEVDFRRHVQGATLQHPVFFVTSNGGIGFWLPDILEGRDSDLYNRDGQAPLGGRTTTKLHINWPGYAHWRCQISIRDQTYRRNPITVGRFMKRIGTSVNNFINNCLAADPGSDPRWRIAPDGITQRHVKVVGAVHVSAGSWMPIIQLTRYVL